MKTYFILRKSESVIALEIYDEDLSEIINALQQQGYEILSDNCRALNKSQAIEAWKPKELTQLEKANNTIRMANKRINELKIENRYLNDSLNEIRKKYELLNSMMNEVEKENEKLRNGKNRYGLPASLELLGFSTCPGKLEIKKRYKKLCSVYHPDKGSGTIMMQIINNAYEDVIKKSA